MKILLADDDPKIHFIVKLWLSKNGHEVETINNGRSALEKLSKGDFDILITDVNMPLMNGVELVRSVLRLNEHPKLIVVMTSRCDTNQLQKEFETSAVIFINKPFSPAGLSEKIERFSFDNAR